MPDVEKHDLVDLEIDLLSGVDRPAQEPATVDVIKTATPLNTPKTDPQEPTVTTSQTDIAKANERVSDLEKSVATHQRLLKNKEALLALTDEQRRYFQALPGADQDVCFDKGAAEVLAKAVALVNADTVVFTSKAGHVFRKSDDHRLVDAIKAADAAAEKLEKAATEAQAVTLEKRAVELLKSVPGSAGAKGALLRAIEGITDEAVRKEALDILTKANAAAAVVTSQQVYAFNGHDDSAPESPLGKIEKLAKSALKANPDKYNGSYEVAYDAVLETPEGERLYAEYQAGAEADLD